MRIYANCKEAITDIARELKKCSTLVQTQTMQNKDIHDDPDFETREIEFFDFCIINTDDKDEMPGVTLEWARAEFQERISKFPVNPGKAYLLREEVWDEFLNENMKFDYNYNERISWQIPKVVSELSLHPETRQAVINIFQSSIDIHLLGKERVPCSLSYQFLKRNGALDIIYMMRSSDFSTHFQNDIWLATELRNYIAEMLKIPRGKFFMLVNSLHIYRRDWNQLTRY